jgi:hypothetical protein
VVLAAVLVGVLLTVVLVLVGVVLDWLIALVVSFPVRVRVGLAVGMGVLVLRVLLGHLRWSSPSSLYLGRGTDVSHQGQRTTAPTWAPGAL